MKKCLMLALAISALVFSGCGGGGGSDSGNISPEIETRLDYINYSSDYDKLFEIYYDTVQKSEYETTVEYNNRVAQLVNDENANSRTYTSRLETWFDADSETLYVYEINLGYETSDDEYIFSYDNGRYLYVNGFASVPIYLTYLEHLKFFNDDAVVFKTISVDAEEAQELSAGFYLELQINLNENEFVYKSSTPLGAFYKISGQLKSLKVLNSRNDEVYYEQTFL